MVGAQVRHQAAAMLCQMCLLACLASLTDGRAMPDLAKPDYSLYLHKPDLLNRVRDIVQRAPESMALEVLREGDAGYSTEMMVVTAEPGGVKGNHHDKLRVLVVFGEHGRELISSELGLRFVQTLADPAAFVDVLGDARARALLPVLHRTVFKVVPMENTNGRDLVEGGKLCERKNGRGVDPNRNWDVHWGFKEKDYDPKEEYPGKAPLSEPETKLLHRLAREFKPHAWLNVHSGMEAMFVPYDHVATVPPGAKPALSILQAISQEVFGGKMIVGSGGKSVGYLAHGTATDYMFEKLGVPVTFTWEIYGDEKASYHDCFRMFNPLTKEGMTDVYRKWLPAIYKMLELLPSHPQVAGQVAGIGAASQAAAAAGGGASAVGRVPHNVALTSSVGPNSSRPVAAAAPVGGAQPAAQALLLAQQPVAAAGRHALITPLLRAWASWLAGVAGMAVVVTVVLGYVRPGLLPRQARMLHKLAQTGSSSAAI